MIEEKLIENGATLEDLEKFSTRPLHNAKKNFLLRIVQSKDIFHLRETVGERDSFGTSINFYENLFEILRDIGINEFNYRRDSAAQRIANGLYATINIKNKYGQHEKVGLDRIYRDTIKRLENKNE